MKRWELREADSEKETWDASSDLAEPRGTPAPGISTHVALGCVMNATERPLDAWSPGSLTGNHRTWPMIFDPSSPDGNQTAKSDPAQPLGPAAAAGRSQSPQTPPQAAGTHSVLWGVASRPAPPTPPPGPASSTPTTNHLSQLSHDLLSAWFPVFQEQAVHQFLQ